MTENNNTTNDRIVTTLQYIGVTNKDDSNTLKVEKTNKSMEINIKAGECILANKQFILGNNVNYTVYETVDSLKLGSLLIQVDLINNTANIIYRESIMGNSLSTPELINNSDDSNTDNNTIKEYRLANIHIEVDTSSTDNTNVANLYVYENYLPEQQTFINVTENETTNLPSYLSNTDNNIYYFPKGTYSIEEHIIHSCSNVTIYAPSATFVRNSAVLSNSLFQFLRCENCRIIGGVYNGAYGEDSTNLKYGIWVNESPYSTIKDVVIKNIGIQATQSSAGINFSDDCSNSIIDNVTIDNVQAGEKDTNSNYIFASGIAFNTTEVNGSDENGNKPEILYSQNVIIKDAIISNIGNADFRVENTKLDIDGDGIYIIQRPKYLDAGTTNLSYEEKETVQASLESKYGTYTDNTFTDITLADGIYEHYREATEQYDRKNCISVTVRNGKVQDKCSVKALCEVNSNIDIINPKISNCSKRAIKVSTWGVNIYGGEINISGWSAAIEYQYTRNSTVSGVSITNNKMTCLTICGGDGTMVVDKCCFHSDSGTGNGIVLYKENSNNSNIKNGGENIIISNCCFNNVNYPIYGGLSNWEDKNVVSNSIIIQNCKIGHFKGDAAIKLSPNRFVSLNTLEISDLTFVHGNSETEIFNANNAFFTSNEDTETESNTEQHLIDLGYSCNPVNPVQSLTINIPSLQDDLKEIFKYHFFTSESVTINGPGFQKISPSSYPEYIRVANIIKPNEYNLFKITGERGANSYVIFTEIEEFNIIAGTEYLIKFTSDVTFPSHALSIGLYTRGKSRVNTEIALNRYKKDTTFLGTENKTAKYIGVKFKKINGNNDIPIHITAYINFGVTTKLPVLTENTQDT